MAQALQRFTNQPTDPKPPACRDPRNAQSAALINSAMKKHADKGAEVSIINMRRGFRASAPDLGKLQRLMAPHFAGLSMAEIQSRKAEIDYWIFETLGIWVQRTKSFKVDYDSTADHVYIMFSTKDDEGWYDYAFSIYVPPVKKKRS